MKCPRVVCASSDHRSASTRPAPFERNPPWARIPRRRAHRPVSCKGQRRRVARLQGHSLRGAARRPVALEAPVPMPRLGRHPQGHRVRPACVQPKPTLVQHLRGPADAHERGLPDAQRLGARGMRPQRAGASCGSTAARCGAASSDPLYDGAKPGPARGTVVVSINYRLGRSGLARASGAQRRVAADGSRAITACWTRSRRCAGSAQHRRLRRRSGFNVTIAGESAGGLSVMYLMASPARRAGCSPRRSRESAYMISTPELKARNTARRRPRRAASKLAAALKAPDHCGAARDGRAEAHRSGRRGRLRAPSAAVDGHVLPGAARRHLRQRGEQAPVPLLAGFNSGEIRSLRALAPPVPANARPITSPSSATAIGDLADKFLKLYPGTTLQESILAAPRAMRCTAGPPSRWCTSRPPSASRPICTSSITAIPAEDAAAAARLPRSELPYVFGTFDRTPPLWPKAPPGRSARPSAPRPPACC
jgi:para-nitrobenzyl esterase